MVSIELSKLLQTELKVGRIDMGLLNRIIIEDFYVADQSKQDLLKVSRLSARFDIQALFQGKISINSVQLFGFDLKLRKQTHQDKLNLQFIIDALSSPDSDNESNIDLRINSLLIRRGKMSYDVASEPETKGQFNPSHVRINEIVGTIALKALQKDSLNAHIKRLNISEESGFKIDKLSLKVIANLDKMKIDDIELALPATQLSAQSIDLDYTNITSFNQFADSVDLKLRTNPSYFTLSDFKAFVPAFKNFNDRIDISLQIEGKLNELQLNELDINANNHLRIQGEGSLLGITNPKNAIVYAQLKRCFADQEGLNFLVRNFSESSDTPPVLQRLGFIDFKGELSGYLRDFVTYGTFKTQLGAFSTDLQFIYPHNKDQINYNGRLQTNNFELGKLANNKAIGKISFDAQVVGEKLQAREWPHIVIDGVISQFDYNKYDYNNITISGLYKNGGFDGSLQLADENADIDLLGSFNLAQEIPSFNFIAKINNIHPYDLHLTETDENASFSVEVDANFTGKDIDKLNGEININNFNFTSDRQDYAFTQLNIKAKHDNETNKLIVDSDFFKALIDGEYNYSTLYNSFINTAKMYLPAVTSQLPVKSKANNNFYFSLDLIDTGIFTKMLNIPFQTYSHSTLSGYINDKENRIKLEGYFPKFRYGNQFFESGMILLQNPDDILNAHIRLSKKKRNRSVNFSLEASAKDDFLQTKLHWGNNDGVTYSGEFNTETQFELTNNGKKKHLDLDMKILPSTVILNDTIWRVHPSQVSINQNYIAVNNFLFSNDNQFVHIDGKVSDAPSDSLIVDLNQANLGYIFEMADIVETVDFNGKVTGKAYASQLFGETPILNTSLHVANFTYNDGAMGDMDIYGAWNQEDRGIFLDAQMNQKDKGITFVKGNIYLAPRSGLDLDIKANGTNLKFLEGYMNGIASDVNGKAYGKVHLHGPFQAINLEGAAKAIASLKFDVLNTSFAINDSVRMHKKGIDFKNMQLEDPEGNRGSLHGELHYQHFKDLSYRFNINSKNMLIMNTKESNDMPFYGKIYASGTTILSGNSEGLNVNAQVSTGPNSNFNYSLTSVASAMENQFIQFNDKTVYRNVGDTGIRDLEDEMDKHITDIEEDSEPIDIRLNLQIEGTPNLTVKIITDPVSGDNITAKGSGDIRTEFYNKGNVRMFGTYQIESGMYKFSLQEVIRKNFIIKKGSNITFNGDPMEAILDIRAQYTVNSVALSDLLPNDALLNTQPHIKVNCLLNVTGPVERPEISFEIEIPNEREDIQTLVRNYINTEEQLNMQVLYLLGIGKFYTTDSTKETSDVMSSVISSTLSGQLNDMLSQMINNNNWSIGTNLSTGSKGWTDVEIEGMLSGQMLNNRLLINGNFGYRDNPYATTNFVGDFEAELLLNKSGNIRLRAYSRSNDRYLFKTNMTTQGIGIMFRKDFVHWREFLFWNNIKAKRKRNREEAERRRQQEEEELNQQPTAIREEELN